MVLTRTQIGSLLPTNTDIPHEPDNRRRLAVVDHDLDLVSQAMRFRVTSARAVIASPAPRTGIQGLRRGTALPQVSRGRPDLRPPGCGTELLNDRTSGGRPGDTLESHNQTFT